MLRTRLLGGLEIEYDGAPVEIESRPARALFAWLALERRMHSRGELAGRFWPDVLDESARTSLRGALSALRRSLGPGADCLVATREHAGLAGEDEVWTDVAEFERLVAADRIEEALGLCTGELLAGLDDDWVHERRREHADRVGELLSELAARAERAGDLEGALRHTRRLVALDPLAEGPQRELIRRLAAAGDRAAALSAYDRLAERLRNELRIVPSAATRELVDRLRTETAAASPAPSATGPRAGTVTLLFTDLVGSTELLDELGDDEAERLRRTHFGLLREAALDQGGHEVKNLGDGLMVAFGSSVDALACARGIQRAVHRHNTRERDDRLRVRVGLHVGEPIRDEDDYFGTPVVIAKRLCDQAEGGQILASELVRALVGSRGGFEFRTLEPRALKGISQPVPACEVAWEAPLRRIALPPVLADHRPTPLVGREAELDALRAELEAAREARPRVVMLAGEPGIGKSRLAAELCRHAHADGEAVLLGRCHEEALVPYEPFVEALRHYVKARPPDELDAQLGHHRGALSRLLPELGEQPAAEGDEDAARFRLFDAVASVLGEASAAAVVVLVLDDLHWAGDATLQLLRHVARTTADSRLLIVGTYRATELSEDAPLAQALAELRRARRLVRIDVGGLDADEVAELIGGAVPPDAVRSIHASTEGNPFFVEEMLRSIEEAGVDDTAAALAGIGVPESVKDLVLRRLRGLGEPCRDALATAAVLGREFSIDALAAVTETQAGTLAATLEEAIAAHTLTEVPAAVGRYRFAHALIRETIHDRLSATRRAQLHGRAGAALERLLGERASEQAGALARHFSAAGIHDKALEFHALASDAAARVHALQLAEEHADAALAAATALERDAATDGRVRALLQSRGMLRQRIGDLSGYEDSLAAVQAARAAGDRVIELRGLVELGFIGRLQSMQSAAEYLEEAITLAEALGDAGAQVLALDRLSLIRSNTLAFDEAIEMGDRALAIARRLGDDEAITRAMDGLKLAAWQLGDIARLDELTSELERIQRSRDDLWYLVYTLLERAEVPAARGDWEAATALLDESMAIAERIGARLVPFLIHDRLAALARTRGAYDRALQLGRLAYTNALPMAGEWHGWTAATVGLTLLDLRAGVEAAEVLRAGAAGAESTGGTSSALRCLGPLAWAECLAGDHDAAAVAAARAEELLTGLGAPPGGAYLFGHTAYAALARLHLADGDPARAAAIIAPALGAAERSGWLEAIAVLSLVRGLCAEATGEHDRAVDLLGRAATIADAHGIPAPGWEAHAALDRLGAGDEHGARARDLIEQISSAVSDPRLREGLLAAAPA